MAGKVFKLELGGEQVFLAGYPPALAGHRFSGVVTEGCIVFAILLLLKSAQWNCDCYQLKVRLVLSQL